MRRPESDTDTEKKRSGHVRLQRLLIYTVLLVLVLTYAGTKQQMRTKEAQQKVERLKKLEQEKKEQEKQEQEKKDRQTAQEQAQKDMQEGGAESAGGGTESGYVLTEEDMWSLVLTNESHPVPEGYQINLAEVPGTGQSVDERIYEPLMQMLDAARQQGISLTVCSGYRTKEKQEELFGREMQGYIDQGDDAETAYSKAKQSVSVPESGEHRIGLAVDIYSPNHPVLDEAFGDTPEGLWLREHAPEYGFILRYDRGKEASTGILYEPWHFRYVGVSAAGYITARGMSLEEFYIQESLYE